MRYLVLALSEDVAGDNTAINVALDKERHQLLIQADGRTARGIGWITIANGSELEQMFDAVRAGHPTNLERSR